MAAAPLSSSSSTDAYRVRAELLGHEGAVRSVSVLPNDVILTGAMDSTVRCWIPNDTAATDNSSSNDSFVALESATIYDHEHWVTASMALPAGIVPECPDGGFVTGSMDKHIRIYRNDGTRVALLMGHAGGVTSLALSTCRQYVLSGSWDGTARAWDVRSKQCAHVLEGHENGVCVLALPTGVVVTGSTGRQVGNSVVDFQLRFWTDFALTKTVADHSGPIRQLALVPDIGFVSCSNDGSIKIRTLDGDVVTTMEHPLNAEGKPGFVLGVAVLPNGSIVSASEDCTARVWAPDGALQQVIEHPRGLWCVASLGNGDFVTGGDDKVARVFTADASRVSQTATASFEHAVQDAQRERAHGPSSVEVDALPSYERRGQVVGKSDGQIQMFKKGAAAWACQWSAPSKTWLDIGEVTGTAGSGGTVDGQAYDMVIPVEIELPSGVKKLEIGYNQGENPFSVAQAFIDKHVLDQTYLREIADYITQRAGDYRAPVIGGGASTTSASGDAMEVDATATAGATYKYFPVAGYNTFEATKIGKLMPTLRQYNETLAGRDDTATLSAPDLIALETVVRVVQETAFYHSSTFASSELRVLVSLVTTWPPQLVFPALDLLRLVVVHPHGPTALGDATLRDLVDRMLQLGLQGSATTAGSNSNDDVPTATRMLALRVLANLFRHDAGRHALLARKTEVLAKLSEFVVFRQKTIALSLATVLLNFARLHIESPSALTQDDVVTIGAIAASLLNGAFTVEELGDDTVLRALVTIGTLTLGAYPDAKQLQAVHLSIFLGLKAASVTAPAVKECLDELQLVLSA